MRIGLFGFGRTGRLVAEEIIKDPECELAWVVRDTKKDNHEYASHFLGYPQSDQGFFFSKEETATDGFYAERRVDAIIDFSSAEAVYEYASAADYGTRIVSAISHYGDAELEVLRALAQKTAVLHSPNITLGINFLLVASQILKQIVPHADIEVIEEHFRQKARASGTALKIAEKLGLDPVKHVNSIRVGGIIGKHEVVFGLPNQTIRLTHEAISRAAFGTGAIFAAKSLASAGAGLYTMEEIMRSMIIENIAPHAVL